MSRLSSAPRDHSDRFMSSGRRPLDGASSMSIGFANVFVPLNDDGLRADAVPSMGLEVSF